MNPYRMHAAESRHLSARIRKPMFGNLFFDIAIRVLLLIAVIALIALALPGAARAADLPGGAVTIPWNDFQKILTQLQPQPTPDPEPPVEFTIGRGTLSGTLVDDRLDVRATYPLSVPKKGWAMVPLVAASAPVVEVLLDGKPASVRDDGGMIALVVKGPSEHELSFRFRATATMRPGPGAVSLPLPRAAGQVLKLDVGARVSDVTADGATVSREGKAIVAILTGDHLTLRYNVAVESGQAVAARPAKIDVETHTLVSIDEGFVRAVANVAYTVRHAPVTRFSLAVPDGYEVADATGTSLAAWRVEEGKLVVDVGYEVTGDYALTVVLERTTEGKAFDFPLPALDALDAERERGFVAVQATGGVQVEIASEGDLTPVDPKELPDALRAGATNPIVLAFKAMKQPASATLAVKRHETHAVLAAAIDSANYVVQLTDDGDAVTQASYMVRNNRQQFLAIELPGGKATTLWSSFVGGRPVKPSVGEDGRILLPLEKSGYVGQQLSTFEVEVIYHTRLPENIGYAGTLDLALPKVDLPVSQSALSVFAPERFRYARLSGSMRDAHRAVPATATFAFRPAEEADVVGDEGFAMNQPMGAAQSALGGRMEAKDEVTRLDKRQMEAEYNFQSRIRAAREATSEQGALPAKFVVPRAGVALRFSELLTIGQAPTLTLGYAAMWMRDLFGYLALAAAFLFAVNVVRLYNAGRRGRGFAGGGLAGLIAFASAGAAPFVIAGLCAGAFFVTGRYVAARVRVMHAFRSAAHDAPSNAEVSAT
ncbi:hypothetical protein K8I61_05775 [bacterium]|nr:hypothetical protein [bacterium]